MHIKNPFEVHSNSQVEEEDCFAGGVVFEDGQSTIG